MSKEKAPFWDRVLGNEPSSREERVVEYILHRLSDGGHLADIVEEEYVQRNASPNEIHEICSKPRLVHAARERMEHAFDSGELDPDPPKH